MAENWVKIQKEITKEFEDIGVLGYLGANTIGNYDITTGLNVITTIEHEVFIIIGDMIKTDNTNILFTDIEMKMTMPSTIKLTELKNLTIKVSDILYTILEIKPIMPGGIILYYKLHCRS